jgi:DNA-binding transcriptional regulator GbsR (MarR family)
MSDVVMQDVLDSFAKIGKHWELGESVGRVCGFMLLKSCPVTQREVEEGTGYSRGFISRCLTVLKDRHLIEVSSAGKENLYSINTSLTENHGKFVEQFLTEELNPIIDVLSGYAESVEDGKVKGNILKLLHEMKKLNLAFRIFLGIIWDINMNVLAADIEEVEDYVVTVAIGAREDYGKNIYF